MPVTYDLTTPVGKLRLKIQDKDLTNPIFQDEELQAFLDEGDQDLNYAAGLALLAIANDKARLAKRIRLGDYDNDSSRVDIALREQAKMFFNLAEGGPADDVAEWDVTDFARRDRIMNELISDE